MQRKACHNNSFINLVFIHFIQILPDMTNVLDIYKIVRNWLLASKINFLTYKWVAGEYSRPCFLLMIVNRCTCYWKAGPSWTCEGNAFSTSVIQERGALTERLLLHSKHDLNSCRNRLFSRSTILATTCEQRLLFRGACSGMWKVLSAKTVVPARRLTKEETLTTLYKEIVHASVNP